MADFSLSQNLTHTTSDVSDEEDEVQHSPPQTTLFTPVILSNPTSTTASSSSSRHNPTTTTTPTHLIHSPPAAPPTGSGDMTNPSTETSRKPRGRPRGSKNKPKPPVYITRETEPMVKTQQLEIPSGSDIVELVQIFAGKYQVGVNILNAFGTVSNVTLRHPTHGQSITLSGAFDLLCLSGTFLGSSVCSSSKTPRSSSNLCDSGLPSSCLSIFLAGNAGQVFGGIVVGKVVAASSVLLNVSTFCSYEFHRLLQQPQQQPTSGGEESENFDDHRCCNMGNSNSEMNVVYNTMNVGGGGGNSSGAASPSPSPSPSPVAVPDVLTWGSPARPPHY